MRATLLNWRGRIFFYIMSVVPTREQYPVNFTGIEKESNVVSTTPTVLKSEYLAGGYLGDQDTLTVLMHSQDMWSAQLTDDKIDLMLKDPEIYKCYNVVRNGVLGDGVTFSPAVTEPATIPKPMDGEFEPEDRRKERLSRDQQVERYNLAKKYTDFASRAFDNLETPFRQTLTDMLSALPYGNRTAEKVFEEKMDADFGRKLLYFKRLNVKPRKAVIFVVDKYWNLVGLKTYIKVKDEDGNETFKEKVIKKEKFAILTFGGENGDPRGKSFLTSAYTSYQLKMQLWPEYLRWLIYSAVPPVVGYTSDQTDSRKVLRDANGEIIYDKDNNIVMESDVGGLLYALKQVRNASAIALPFGAKVETLNSSVSGDPFKGFRDVVNQEIEMGLIHQTLATSDSRHNTRAASQTHISILDDLVWAIKGIVRDMVTGMVKHLMRINFPDFDEALTPIVSMGDTARREFAGDVGAVSQLSISGFLGESQKVGLDNLLGLPTRDVFSDREYERQKEMEKLNMQVRLQKLTNPSPQPEPSTEPVQTPAKDSGE